MGVKRHYSDPTPIPKTTCCKRVSRGCCQVLRDTAEKKNRQRTRAYLHDVYAKGMDYNGELSFA